MNFIPRKQVDPKFPGDTLMICEVLQKMVHERLDSNSTGERFNKASIETISDVNEARIPSVGHSSRVGDQKVSPTQEPSLIAVRISTADLKHN